PYNVFEREQELTRGFLKLADRYRFVVVVITKSDLVCRDVDLFTAIGAHSPAAVNITITAADDAVAKQIEPHAASSSDRFCAIETLSAKGIVCGVILLPVLPFLTDTKENITRPRHHLPQQPGAAVSYRHEGKYFRDRFACGRRRGCVCVCGKTFRRVTSRPPADVLL
ncbi:MAG TPA: hypothetical protein O0X38_07625, partial [Methanocorpusculum sp.]|nr:hypothetical protein [Methanocorpusculum sp.]